MEIGILPLLLERKSLILSRTKSLVGERRIESLNDLVATVADPELRAKIESELSVIAAQSRRLAEQESTVAQAQSEQIAKREEALAKAKAEADLLERRLRAWTGFFAKESMATYVGAFLLIVLTFVQVAAMFLGGAYKSKSSVTLSSPPRLFLRPGRLSGSSWAGWQRSGRLDLLRLNEKGAYDGRPVDVAQLPDGSLIVPDDYAGDLYQITYDGYEGAMPPK
jgi:hypothetical protein